MIDLLEVISFANLRLTRASLVTFLAGFITAVISMVLKPNLWPVSLYLMLLSIVAAYNQNCAVVGHCNTWALIMFGVFLLTVALNLFVAFSGKSSNIVIKKK